MRGGVGRGAGDGVGGSGLGKLVNTPDWSGFEEATFAPWLTAPMQSPDGTAIGGRRS